MEPSKLQLLDKGIVGRENAESRIPFAYQHHVAGCTFSRNSICSSALQEMHIARQPEC